MKYYASCGVPDGLEHLASCISRKSFTEYMYWLRGYQDKLKREKEALERASHG